jgi:hypothetical protein
LGERCSKCVDVVGGGKVIGSTLRPGRREYRRHKRDVRDVEGDGGREESSVSR